jgi:hypothetical protein
VKTQAPEATAGSEPGGDRGPRFGLAVRWVGASAAAGVAFVAIFLLYFLIYRVRHFSLPLGWDTPWYVWRADFVGHVGLGPLETSARPGHPLLAATLSSVTGLSAVRLEVLLPFVLVAMFALAVGAATAEGLGRADWWRWSAAVAVSGVTIGTTRLVGENVSNLMNVLFVVVAFLFLIRFVVAGRGFVGAVLMLLAAGLSHWLFMAVFALVFGAWFLLALPSSRRARREGTALWRTESGALAAAGGLAAAGILVLIYPVLGSSFKTREIGEEQRRYLPKFREDLAAMAAWGVLPAAAFGGVALAKDEPRRAAPFLRMVAAWAAVCVAGTVVAAVTLVVPPHRFLGLLVAVPVAVALAALVWTVGRWVARRAGRVLGVAAGLAIVAALAIPTVAWWYGPAGSRRPEQWFDQAAFDQARSIRAYVDTLHTAGPVVVLVGPLGTSGPISISLKERTVRAGLAPTQQERVFVIPGSPADALAGRFTRVPNPDFDSHNRVYFDDGAAALRSGAPIVIPEALGQKEFQQAVHGGAKVVAPGVALLRGPPPPAPIPAPGPLHVVPRSEVGLLWAVALVALLGVAGLGWTAWFLPAGARPLTLISLAPTVGAGTMILGALVTAKLGLHLTGPAGVATFSVVAAAGFAAVAARSVRTNRPLAGAEPSP